MGDWKNIWAALENRQADMHGIKGAYERDKKRREMSRVKI